MSARKNIAWYGLPSLLERLGAVLLLPLYTRVLQPNELGTAMVAVAFGSLSGLLVAPGTEKIYLRFMVGADRSAVSAIAFLHVTILILGLTVLLVFAEPIAALAMPGIPPRPFYFVVVVSAALATLMAPVMAEWRAQHHAKKVALLDSARVTISLATILIALLWFEWGPVSILLGNLVAAMVLLPISARKLGELLSVGWTSRHLREVLPLLAVGFPMAFHEYTRVTLDRLALNRFSGEGEVAIYGVGYALGAVLMVGTMVMNREWLPLVMNLAARRDPDEAGLQQLWTQSLCLFLVLGSVLALGARDLVAWFAGAEYAASAAIVPWVVVIGVLRIPRVFMQGLAYAHGESRTLLWDAFVSVGVFIVAIFVLVPGYGALGAAWAGVLGTGVGTLYLYSRRWNPYRLQRSILPYAVVLGAAMVIGGANGGGAVSRAGGLMILAVLGYQGLQYWNFLATLQPLTAES